MDRPAPADDTAPMLWGVPAREARVVCAVVHGRYGAPDAMMEHLVRHLTAPGVHYVLPRAAGNQWYAAQTCGPISPETEAEIAAGLDQVSADIAAAMARAGSKAKLVVGGFSQGACLSIEYAAANGPWDGALFALTGCRVGAAGHGRPMKDLAGLHVYVSNGSADPFIRLPEFTDTLRDLAAAGARVRSDLFPRSDHVMSPPEIATVDALLRLVANEGPLFETGAA